MEIAGKSSSEEDAQGATFSGAESLMGTISDPDVIFPSKLFIELYLILSSI